MEACRPPSVPSVIALPEKFRRGIKFRGGSADIVSGNGGNDNIPRWRGGSGSFLRDRCHSSLRVERWLF